MSANELETKIRDLKELQQFIEEAEAEADALRDSIKEHMGDTQELNAGPFKVRWAYVTAARFDSAAFKKANPDVYGLFTKTSTTRRFSVA